MNRLAANMSGFGTLLAAAGTLATGTPLAASLPGRPAPGSTPMALGRTVVAPIAAIRFCMDNAAECQSGRPATVALTEERWAELEAVNREVNAAITPKPDEGLDTWTLGAAAGDCDDYAVEKRHRLIARGWPRGAVTLAVARIGGGEFHLLTVVATDQGDYVLDNRNAAVRPWQRTGYRWLMRSEPRDPRLWQAIDSWPALRMAHNPAGAAAAAPTARRAADPIRSRAP
jgi:predicted transglutaminase-like cysteine proteinase